MTSLALEIETAESILRSDWGCGWSHGKVQCVGLPWNDGPIASAPPKAYDDAVPNERIYGIPNSGMAIMAMQKGRKAA